MSQKLFEELYRQLLAENISPQKAMQLAAVEAGLPFDDVIPGEAKRVAIAENGNQRGQEIENNQ